MSLTFIVLTVSPSSLRPKATAAPTFLAINFVSSIENFLSSDIFSSTFSSGSPSRYSPDGSLSSLVSDFTISSLILSSTGFRSDSW